VSLNGDLLIGSASLAGSGTAIYGYDPAACAQLAPAYAGASGENVEQACEIAETAFALFSYSSPAERAALLDAIAANLEADAEAIVARAMAETGLPEVRCRGELGRTTNQLRLFARVVRDGSYLDVRIDRALPERAPPRPDLRLMNQPIGPVAVFGASNFPIAFSVAGGDTASALAAGCPVIVKAHHPHPGTSELAGRAIQKAVAECGLPEGVFSLLYGSGADVGAALVADGRIQGVGFTGSRSGGTALMQVAQARPQSIPVYAEMSSINPVILLPGALAERGEAIGTAFAGALTLGAGQFCTNPGLLVALEGAGFDAFISGTQAALSGMAAATMLTPGIHAGYCKGRAALETNPRVRRVAEGPAGEGHVSQSALYETTAANFIADKTLQEEMFGAASLLVRCADRDEIFAVLCTLEGQLTVSVHADGDDQSFAQSLLPVVQRLAGRVLFNGFGTGVEVCDAMVHGGPFPSTSDGRSTSVGSLAIARWLRPVCYQDVPAVLLPPPVRDDNPWGVPQRIDGARP
jgi:2,5-dioxopentanoate dehydrogenase